MAELNKCGHSVVYTYRVRDGPIKKYCLACLFDKVNFTDLSGQKARIQKKEEKSQPLVTKTVESTKLS